MRAPRVAIANGDFCIQSLIEPSELAIVGGMLATLGCEVCLADPGVDGLTPQVLGERVAELQPDMLLLCSNRDTSDLLDQWAVFVNKCCASHRQSPGLVVAFGTRASTFAPEHFAKIPQLDGVIIGEPEQTIADIAALLTRTCHGPQSLQHLAGVVTRKTVNDRRTVVRRRRIDSLDDLPFGNRSVLVQKIQRFGARAVLASVLSGRGCSHNQCTFCDVPLQQGLQSGPCYRKVSPARIIAEVDEIIGRYGVRRFIFQDEDFVPPGDEGHAYLQELRARIKERSLRFQYYAEARVTSIDRQTAFLLAETGCSCVCLGVESVYPDDLELFNKGLTVATVERCLSALLRAGYSFRLSAARRVRLGYITFHPFATCEGIKRGIDFYRRYGISPKRLLFTRLESLPGTRMHDLIERNGLLLDGDSSDGYRYRFVSEEVGSIRAQTWRFLKEFYSYRERIRVVEKVCSNEDLASVLAGLPDIRRHIDATALSVFDSMVSVGLGENGSPEDIKQCYEEAAQELATWLRANRARQRIESAERCLRESGLQLVAAL